ncbi:MAG: hypothetical protein R3F37_14660 [Candidatus Competibacteraceae bacterium]
MNTSASLGSTAASSVLPFILLAAGLLAAVMIYTPGLSGPFFFDDIPHIQNNPHLRPDELNATTLKLAAFSTTHAESFQRPVSMASFAFNYYFFGEDPTSFKAINLGIHLINGILIFLLAQRLFRLAAQRANPNPEPRSGHARRRHRCRPLADSPHSFNQHTLRRATDEFAVRLFSCYWRC